METIDLTSKRLNAYLHKQTNKKDEMTTVTKPNKRYKTSKVKQPNKEVKGRAEVQTGDIKT